MRIKITAIREAADRALVHYGYDEGERATILDVLLYAQLRGNSQGVVKLVGRGIPKDKSAGKITTVKETPVSAIIDGAGNHAMVVVSHAANVAIEKAKKSGIGIVGVHGISTSSGAIGAYARTIAQAGFASIVSASGPPTVALHGSSEALMCTNPLAIAAPRMYADPIVLDITTASMAYFAVMQESIAGRALPEGVAYDREGNPTRDASKALDGALTTMDKGKRGSGLAFMLQILAGPLVGSEFFGIEGSGKGSSGHVLVAIDPEILAGFDTFSRSVEMMVERAKAARRIPGVDEILLPGERGDRATNEVIDKGEIEIDEKLWNELKSVGTLDAGKN